MTYEAISFGNKEFILTRDAAENQRKPFLVPDMFKKLESGFRHAIEVLKGQGLNTEEPAVEEIQPVVEPIAVEEEPVELQVEPTPPNEDLEFTMTEIPTSEPAIINPEPFGLAKIFKEFKHAKILDSQGICDKDKKVISPARKLAISSMFKNKLTTNTEPINAPKEMDVTEIIEEIKALFVHREEAAAEIAKYTAIEEAIQEKISELKATYNITDEMIQEGKQM